MTGQVTDSGMFIPGLLLHLSPGEGGRVDPPGGPPLDGLRAAFPVKVPRPSTLHLDLIFIMRPGGLFICKLSLERKPCGMIGLKNFPGRVGLDKPEGGRYPLGRLCD